MCKSGVRYSGKRAAASASDVGGDRRLYQRRQVDLVQPARARERVRSRSAVRHSGYHHAPAAYARGSRHRGLGHGGIHPRSSAYLGGGVSRDLEATVQADLLLHVVDDSSPVQNVQIEEVNRVLEEIGAGAIPQIIVLNKADVTGLPAGLERDEYGRIARLRVSAKTGAGTELVRLAIDEFRSGVTLPDSSSRAVA